MPRSGRIAPGAKETRMPVHNACPAGLRHCLLARAAGRQVLAVERNLHHSPASNAEQRQTVLARIIHESSATAADPAMPTALRSVGFLDVLSSTPAESSRRAPCSHARLRRLATHLHEECGLEDILQDHAADPDYSRIR